MAKNRDKQNEQKDSRLPEKKSKLNCKFFTFLFFLLVVPLVTVQLTPYLKFSTGYHPCYLDLPPSPKFDGNLKQNTLLQNAVYFGKGKVQGAETILFVNDTMYSGLLNGQLARIDENGNPHVIAKSVDNTEGLPCGDYGPLLESNKECGRPLALRFKEPHFIYFTDPFHGIFKVDLTNNEKTLVLSSRDPKFGKRPAKFVNDLDFDGDVIYFTDSSDERELNEAIELHMDGAANGRMFRYNEKTQDLSLLMDKLHFANGIQLTPEKDAVLVAENSFARILKYHIKGPKQGHQEVFLELPGFPDNIRISPHGTLFVAFAAARNPDPSKPASILDFLGHYPLIRKIALLTTNMRAIWISGLLPRYGLAAEYDFNGNLLRSWHDPSGKVIQCVTCMTLHNKKLYLGSFYIDYIGVVDY